MRARHVGLLLALAAIWGSSYLLIKYALEGFDPAVVVFLRVGVASVALLAVVAVQGGASRESLRDARARPGQALLLGFLAIALPFMLITVGEQHVPSGLTAVLIAPASLFVAAFAPFLDRSEAIVGRQAIGLIVGLVGVALLVGFETVSTLEEFLGALGVLAAAASYALSSFVVKGSYGGMPAVSTSAISVSAGALITLPLAALAFADSSPDLRAVLSVVGLGVIHTGLAFVIFYKLIGEIGAGRASLVSYLAPAVALAYGAALLDEAITVEAIAGLVLILAGMWLAARRPATAPEGGEVVECEEAGLPERLSEPVGFRP